MFRTTECISCGGPNWTMQHNVRQKEENPRNAEKLEFTQKMTIWPEDKPPYGGRNKQRDC